MGRRGMSGVTSLTARMPARSAIPGNWPALAVFVAVSLIVAGCGRSQADGKPSPVPVSTLTVPTASPSVASGDDLARRAVLAQYSAFWRALPVASAATTDAQRLRVLVPVTTTPELSQLVKSLAKQRANGQQLYGQDIPHPTVLSMTAQIAKVTDCQDASASGVRDVKTGRKLTVGVPRNPVDVTMVKRGELWKVSVVQYRPGKTC